MNTKIAKTVALLQSLPAVVYVAAAVVAGLVLYGAHERSVGAAKADTKAAQAIAKAALAQSDSANKATARAIEAAETARATARAVVAKEAAVKARADSVARVASNERDAARRLLADSLATVQQLRGQVGRLLYVATADSIAHARELAAKDSTRVSLERALSADSVAIRGAQGAIAKAISRAEAAERLVKMAKPRGGLLSRCGASANYGAIWNGKSFATGPGIGIGCKLWP